MDVSSDSNKKRKGPEGTAVSAELTDPVILLQKLLQRTEEPDPEPQTSIMARRKQIVDINDRMKGFLQLKKSLDDCVEKIVQEKCQKDETVLRALLDSFSPLLSLGASTVSKILDFLDEETMLAVENASITMAQVINDCDHWPRLYQTLMKTRPIKDILPERILDFYRYTYDCSRYFNSLNCLHDEKIQKEAQFLRCIGDHAIAARKLELKGEEHYKYDNSGYQEGDKKRKIQTVENPWFCFVKGSKIEPDCFVRISRVQSPRNDPLLIVQGFGEYFSPEKW